MKKKKKEKIQKVYGTAHKPRLSVFRSNKEISAQIINDMKGETIAIVTTLGRKIQATKSEKASYVGKQIGKQVLDLGIKEVVFDRNYYIYHGRVKSLADAARKVGLKF